MQDVPDGQAIAPSNPALSKIEGERTVWRRELVRGGGAAALVLVAGHAVVVFTAT